MGVIGYIVKLVHIPVNNILVGGSLGHSPSITLLYSGLVDKTTDGRR
jgi:hypothetical protein